MLLVLLSLATGSYAYVGSTVMTEHATATVTKLDGTSMELTYRDADGVTHLGTDHCTGSRGRAVDCAKKRSLGEHIPVEYDPKEPGHWSYNYVKSRTWWIVTAALVIVGIAMVVSGFVISARGRRPRTDAWLARHRRGAAILPPQELPEGVSAEHIRDRLRRSIDVAPGAPAEQNLAPVGNQDWRLTVRVPESMDGWGTRANPWGVRGVYDDYNSRGLFNGFYWLADDDRLCGYVRGNRESIVLAYGLAAFANLGIVALAIGTHRYDLLWFLIVAQFFTWAAWIVPSAVRLQEKVCAQSTVRSLFTSLGGTAASSVRIWDDADAYDRSHGFSLLRRKRTSRESRPRVDRTHEWRRRPWLWVVVRTLLGLPFVYAAIHWFFDPDHHVMALPVSLTLVALTLVVPLVQASRRAPSWFRRVR